MSEGEVAVRSWPIVVGLATGFIGAAALLYVSSRPRASSRTEDGAGPAFLRHVRWLWQRGPFARGSLDDRCRRQRTLPVLRRAVTAATAASDAQEALSHVAAGRITSVGELVHFFRGAGNEKRIVVEPALCTCLSDALGTSEAEAEAVFPSARAREMVRQLLHATEQLRRLEKERATAFDRGSAGERETPIAVEHAGLFQALWRAAGRGDETYSRYTEAWDALGFQGSDPATDLRGGGVLALRQLLHFAEHHRAAFHEMMQYNAKVQQMGEHCWYLLAVVSIQITAQLLLQRDFPFYAPHLEMLYDTVRASAPAPGDGDRTPAVVPRWRLDGPSTMGDQAWRTPPDVEAGLHQLHHRLLLAFHRQWVADRPHVMEFNNFIPKVHAAFFRPDASLWADAVE